jgi:hypothetical protein
MLLLFYTGIADYGLLAASTSFCGALVITVVRSGESQFYRSLFVTV